MDMGEFFDDAAGRDIPEGPVADAIRRQLVTLFLEKLHEPGASDLVSGLSVAQRDYVVQRATEVAMGYPEVALQARMSRVEYGKQWMLGFLDWYTTAPSHNRHDTTSHRRKKEDINAGALMVAKAGYPQIDWQADYLTRADCLWWSKAVSDTTLDRVNRLWGRARVATWQSVRGAFGYIWMPETVAYGGKPISLGWEIVHDWILPKDAAHGVSMLTISHLLSEVTKNKGVGAQMTTSVRANTVGYRLMSNRQEHIIALGHDNTVVTCYRTGVV